MSQVRKSRTRKWPHSNRLRLGEIAGRAPLRRRYRLIGDVVKDRQDCKTRPSEFGCTYGGPISVEKSNITHITNTKDTSKSHPWLSCQGSALRCWRSEVRIPDWAGYGQSHSESLEG